MNITPMDASEIKKLEDKFWQGKTSLEEEKLLKSLAQDGNGNFSQELKTYLLNTTEEKKPSLDKDFDSFILGKVEGKAKVRPMFTRYDFARIAAAIAVIVSLAYFSYTTLIERDIERQTLAKDTFDDPEKAFEETRKALMFAAGMMNKGLEPATELSKFHETELAIQSADDILENDTIKQ